MPPLPAPVTRDELSYFAIRNSFIKEHDMPEDYLFYRYVRSITYDTCIDVRSLAAAAVLFRSSSAAILCSWWNFIGRCGWSFLWSSPSIGVRPCLG